MRHFLGDDHGDLDHAADVAVAVAPGSLVNHLFDALFVNGVTVDGVGGDHVADFLLRLLAVAGHHVLAQHGASVLVKGGPRPLVHHPVPAILTINGTNKNCLIFLDEWSNLMENHSISMHWHAEYNIVCIRE